MRFFVPVTSFLTFLQFSQKMRHSILTLLVILSFMKFCVDQTFWVECQLDVVLEVLQVVGSKFTKLVDIYHRKIH